MTDEEIRKAACEAWDAERSHQGLLAKHLSHTTHAAIAAVYRAGMEAGRAEAAAKPKRRKAAPSAVTVLDLVDDGVAQQHAEDWLRVRQGHKAPLTITAWDAMHREAKAAGITIAKAVQMCAENSWRGFKASYVANGGWRGGPGRAPQAGRMDRQLETAALMTGAARPAPTDMGEIYDVGQQRIARR